MPEGLRLTFLGTGTSDGVPVIGCDCAVCHSFDPRNQRYRCSVVVEWQGKTILVDTPPELRLALLRSDVRSIDALIYTHGHADHIFGLDDVRVFNRRQRRAMPTYGAPATLDNLRRQFFYIFEGASEGGGKPALELHPIEPLDRPFVVEGIAIQPIPVWHGSGTVLGFRFGDVAYVTDTNAISEPSRRLLQNLDVLILDALRDGPHPTHFSLDEAVEVVEELAPRRAFFTHMSHGLDHETTNQRLPPNLQLAYDGLRIESETHGR